jgi:16S rRNA (guanine966-N2)-methyltransferase
MSIIQPHLDDARVVDLFAGSGALGLEALSRGAASADFVEIAASSLRTLSENVAALGASDRATIHRADAIRFAQRLGAGAYDLALADPPYGLGLAEQLARTWMERPFATLLCIEHGAREKMPEGSDRRRYGSTAITFYAHAENQPP